MKHYKYISSWMVDVVCTRLGDSTKYIGIYEGFLSRRSLLKIKTSLKKKQNWRMFIINGIVCVYKIFVSFKIKVIFATI